MKLNDIQLLEEAYLSITKKVPAVSDEDKSLESSETPLSSRVEVGPMDEPASTGSEEVSPTLSTDMSAPMDSGCSCNGECSCNQVDLEQEDEEDQMAISNLNSVRESITKIAAFCASGGHLEIWAQQKLAIAMDNLAEVARRVV
jgi:hypothetical protein